MLDDEADVSRWRVTWVAALTLIRTVGDVLRDSDDEHIRRAYAEAFKNWTSRGSSDDVFEKFIRHSRNRVVHEYRFAVDLSSSISVVVPGQQTQHFSVDENLFRPVSSVDYEFGEDARDVYLGAIAWWRQELTKIELRASESRP